MNYHYHLSSHHQQGKLFFFAWEEDDTGRIFQWWLRWGRSGARSAFCVEIAATHHEGRSACWLCSSLLAYTHDTISDSLDGEAYIILKEEEELLHERSEQSRNNEGNEVEVQNEPNQITQYLYRLKNCCIQFKLASTKWHYAHYQLCKRDSKNYFEHHNNEAPWGEELASMVTSLANIIQMFTSDSQNTCR